MVLSFCCHDTERLFIFSLRHFFEKFLLFDVFFCLFVEFFFAPFGFIRPCRYENAVAALIACCVATPLLVPSLLIVFVLFFFFSGLTADVYEPPLFILPGVPEFKFFESLL